MLEVIPQIISNKMIELVAKGYSNEQADAAIRKSRGWAESLSTRVSAPLREAVFIDLFMSDLQGSEAWLDGIKNSTDRWKDGLNKAGFDVGTKTEAAYTHWSK